jgi:hypothetical protein
MHSISVFATASAALASSRSIAARMASCVNVSNSSDFLDNNDSSSIKRAAVCAALGARAKRLRV